MTCLLAIVALLAQATAPAPEPAVPETLAGDWNGAITLPGDQELAFGVTIRPDGTGTLDIPSQGIDDLPLSRVEARGKSLTFVVDGIPGAPTWGGTLRDDGRIAGTFRQGPGVLAFEMSRGAIAVNRPQEPTGKLPYEAIDVTFPGGAQGVTLAGTLTVPAGEGPFPAAVLITGSGPQDRDESIAGHRPFLVLADRLTRAGIAVLRYDDRGVAASTGDFAAATLEDFAADAAAAAAFLRNRPESAAVGLIGHSEGGYVAPMVASEDAGIAFVVTLAGPGVRGIEVVTRQNVDLVRQAGMTEDQALRIGEAAREAFAAAVDGAAREELEPLMARLVRRQTGLPDADELPERLGPMVEAATDAAMQPWFRGFLAHDPAPSLRATDVPVLALLGEKDLQVAADQNLPALVEALAAHEDATVEVVPDVNHLFQPAETGMIDEYARIETTFDEATMARIAAWIKERS